MASHKGPPDSNELGERSDEGLAEGDRDERTDHVIGIHPRERLARNVGLQRLGPRDREDIYMPPTAKARRSTGSRGTTPSAVTGTAVTTINATPILTGLLEVALDGVHTSATESPPPHA